MKYYQGYFKPVNKEKYVGNINAIIYRSQWECKYMRELDHDPKVLQWSSEEITIPYVSPVDRRQHRYFPDFWVRKQEGDQVQTYIIEIKPMHQRQMPKRGNKRQKTFMKEAFTYATNEAKWAYARQYCQARGWQFKILSETELKVF